MVGYGYYYFGQRISDLAFHYYLHIISESISSFREQYGENSSPDHMTPLAMLSSKELEFGNSLVVQWLRLHTPNARDLGSIPGQGTRSHMLQLSVRMLHLKIMCAATKSWYRPSK